MSEEKAAAPIEDKVETEQKGWKKTAKGGSQRRGPQCEYKMGRGDTPNQQCPRNGLYPVEGHDYCLNHARQVMKRIEKLKEGPKPRAKKVSEPVKEKKDNVEEKTDENKENNIPEKADSEDKDIEKQSGEDTDEDERWSGDKVEVLQISTPKVLKSGYNNPTNKSPPIKPEHHNAKKPTSPKRKRVEFELDDEEKGLKTYKKELKKRILKKAKKYDENMRSGYNGGHRSLKNFFKGATQLNSFGQQKKPSGSVFGLFDK